MSQPAAVLLLLAAATLVVVAALLMRGLLQGKRGGDHYERHERPAMPPELAAGTLYASERYFPSRGELPLGARVDQVYKTGVGVCCVETKTRSFLAVLEADIIELSVQAYVLRTHGHPIAPHGYVRVVRPGQPPVYLRAPLMAEPTLARLIDRYHALHAGKLQPSPARHPARCRGCGQRAKCPHTRK